MRMCIAHMWQYEGIRGFWKGNLAAELMVIPYNALAFWANQFAKKAFFKLDNTHHASPEMNNVMSFVCGAFAGSVGTVGTYPLDLFRTRLAVQKHKEVYSSLSDAVAVVIRRDGVTGLYRGMWPTLLGVAPYMAAQFGVYESLVAAISERRRRNGLSGSLPNHERLATGFVAGVVSKFATLPFDVIKKRSQVDGFDSRDGHPRGLLAPFRLAASIYEHEGVKGLYRGGVPSLVKAGPYAAITFWGYNTCIELCRAWDTCE